MLLAKHLEGGVMIYFLVGDAAKPAVGGHQLLVHVVNDRGGWGKGFVQALSHHYAGVEKFYRDWFRRGSLEGVPFELGNVQFCTLTNAITLANMLAQDGYKSATNPRPLDYTALDKCLVQVAAWATKNEATLHMPRIGTGLAGGDWTVVEALINKHLAAHTVYVYDLSKDRNGVK
jgi:hypothetical protein